MRIFIEHFHVAVSRGIIQIEVILLYVFPVISFAVSESEEPLLENRVVAIPQRQRKAKPGFFVANAGQTVFAPSVGTRTCVIMWKVLQALPPSL